MAFVIDKVILNLDVPPLENCEKVNQVQGILNHLPQMIRAEMARVSALLSHDYGEVEVMAELAPLYLPPVDVEHLLSLPYQFAELVAISVLKQLYGANVKAEVWANLNMSRDVASLASPYANPCGSDSDIASPPEQIYAYLIAGLTLFDKRMGDMANQITNQLLAALRRNTPLQGLSMQLAANSSDVRLLSRIKSSAIFAGEQASSNGLPVKKQLPILLNNPLFFNRFIDLLLSSTDKKSVTHLVWHLLCDDPLSAKNEAIIQGQVAQRESLQQTLIYILALLKSGLMQKEKRLVWLLTLSRVGSLSPMNSVMLEHIFLNHREYRFVEAASTWLSVAQIQSLSAKDEASLISLYQQDKGALFTLSDNVVKAAPKNALADPVNTQEKSEFVASVYRESLLNQLYAWQKIDQHILQLMTLRHSHFDWSVALNTLEHHLYETSLKMMHQSPVSHLIYEARLLRQQLQYSTEALPSHESWLRLNALIQRQKTRLETHYDKPSPDDETAAEDHTQLLFSMGDLVYELLYLCEKERVSLSDTLMKALGEVLGPTFDAISTLNNRRQGMDQVHGSLLSSFAFDPVSSLSPSLAAMESFNQTFNQNNQSLKVNHQDDQKADLALFDKSDLLEKSPGAERLSELLLLLEAELNKQAKHTINLTNTKMMALVSTLLPNLESQAKGSDFSLDGVNIIRHCTLVLTLMPLMHQSPIVKVIKEWCDGVQANRIDIDDFTDLTITLKRLFSSYLSYLTAKNNPFSELTNKPSVEAQSLISTPSQKTLSDPSTLDESKVLEPVQEVSVPLSVNAKFEYKSSINLLYDDNPSVANKAFVALESQLAQHFVVLAQIVNAEGDFTQQYLDFYATADRLHVMYEQVTLWLALEQSFYSHRQNMAKTDTLIKLLSTWLTAYLQVREASLVSASLAEKNSVHSIESIESTFIEASESLDLTSSQLTQVEVSDRLYTRNRGGLLNRELKGAREEDALESGVQIKEQAALMQSLSQTLPLAASKLQVENSIRQLSESVIVDDQYSYDAGLLILWPFLSTLFERLGLLQDDFLEDGKKRKSFISDETQAKAYSLLRYLCGGDKEAGYYGVINLLVGYEFDAIVLEPILLTPEEEKEALSLLEVVIMRWEVLKNMPYSSFQGLFIQRKCLVSLSEMGAIVTVEKQTLDILMQKMPWGLGLIQLPWFESNHSISVEWPY